MSPSCCNADGNHEAKHAAHLSEIFAQFLQKALESAPWLLVGVLLTVLLKRIKLPTESIRNLLSFDSTQPSLWNLFTLCLIASFVGLATPLCSCGALPLALGLSAAGSSPAAVVAFLTAAQSAGLDSVAITYGLLGWRTAVIRLVGAVVLSVGAGMAVGRSNGHAVKVDPKETETETNGKLKKSKSAVDRKSNLSSTIYSMWTSTFNLIDEIWFFLCVGIFISVVMENQWGASDLTSNSSGVNGGVNDGVNSGVGEEEYIPQPDWWDSEEDGVYPEPPSPPSPPPPSSPLTNTFAYQDVATRLTVVLGALPFQLCEHGVVSFASALRRSGASLGTAYAFLLSAPATNIATLGTMLKTGGGSLAPLRCALAISSLAFIMSYVLDAMPGDHGDDLGGAIETLALPELWSTLSQWVCGIMVFQSILLWWYSIVNRMFLQSPKNYEVMDDDDESVKGDNQGERQRKKKQQRKRGKTPDKKKKEETVKKKKKKKNKAVDMSNHPTVDERIEWKWNTEDGKAKWYNGVVKNVSNTHVSVLYDEGNVIERHPLSKCSRGVTWR